ncbi:MAG: methyltransferase RsmF C-terminal domain-like protein [Candidatus Poseidoniales archaeon]
MLKPLVKEKKELIQEYCVERFGMDSEIWNNYEWYSGSKNKIYLANTLDIERIIPESKGICIFRLDKSPKPTTNFLQLFGKYISKNYIEINNKNTIKYCKGDDLILESNKAIVPGFVLITNNKRFLGCGHWNGKLLKNQLPKSKFCNINFL